MPEIWSGLIIRILRYVLLNSTFNVSPFTGLVVKAGEAAIT